jgi:hypothetical protein
VNIDPRRIHDHVASRGELIYGSIITREHPGLGYLFENPRHLGEKKATIDFHVDLITGAHPAYFFAQVKCTRQGYTDRERRLKVAVEGEHMRRLAAYPAPTYIVGIDERSERGYILSANGERLTGFSSMSTRFPLDGDVLAALHAEVEAYWRAGRAEFRSAFLDDHWEEP